MADNRLMTGLIVGFVVLIIGIALLSSSADTTSTLTTTYTATNQSFSGINNTQVEIIDTTNYDMQAVSEVRNSTGSALTVSTDYNVTTANNSITVYIANGTYFTDYTYRNASYIADSGTRNIVALVILFFALAIFGAAIGVVDWSKFQMK